MMALPRNSSPATGFKPQPLLSYKRAWPERVTFSGPGWISPPSQQQQQLEFFGSLPKPNQKYTWPELRRRCPDRAEMGTTHKEGNVLRKNRTNGSFWKQEATATPNCDYFLMKSMRIPKWIANKFNSTLSPCLRSYEWVVHFLQSGFHCNLTKMQSIEMLICLRLGVSRNVRTSFQTL